MAHITLVNGASGVGKTSWIRQHLKHLDREAVYFTAGTGSLPFDALHLGLEFPQLRVLVEGEEAALQAALQTEQPVFIEIAFHLNPLELQQQLGGYDCHWIGVVSDAEHDEMQSYLWADELVTGQPVLPLEGQPHLWRLRLDGQVWDPASLDVFWQELLRGAYGQVQRAKALLEMPEGWSIYGNYVAGLATSTLEDFDVLALPQNLAGRPERLSGLEIVGTNLDAIALKASVQDCCLDDYALIDYQRQIQAAIASGAYTP